MSAIFGKTKIPEPEDPTPLPDEEQATKARRRMLAKEAGSTGAKSTILSSGGRETLGG